MNTQQKVLNELSKYLDEIKLDWKDGVWIIKFKLDDRDFIFRHKSLDYVLNKTRSTLECLELNTLFDAELMEKQRCSRVFRTPLSSKVIMLNVAGTNSGRISATLRNKSNIPGP